MVDRVRRGVAKTIQVASEGEAFDTLPDCDILGTSNRFSIKILPCDDVKPSASDFTPIHLVIKDKKGSRQTVFNCEMIAAQGIVVRTLRGNAVMEIRLPDNSQNSIGKILHPAGSTLYKVEQMKSHSSARKFVISKLGEPFLNIVNTPITQILGSFSNILRYFYCINADQALEFFNLNNEKIGFLRPSYFSTAESVIINYSDETVGVQVQERAAMLGASILFLIVTVRPEYGKMLQNTLH
uniref:Phospholipid scramblase n=1 Tax=Setaria digitata TaxID=48799 RepID=A0A915PRN3_9BILA